MSALYAWPDNLIGHCAVTNEIVRPGVEIGLYFKYKKHYGVVEQKSGLGDSGKKRTKHCSIRVIRILQCLISQLADDLC